MPRRKTAGSDSAPTAVVDAPQFPLEWGQPSLPLRPYQEPVFDALHAGIRRFFLGWHRRAGKDVLAMQVARVMSQVEVGSYWHMFPLQAQAKRAIWNGMTDDGVRFLDLAFPKEMREYQNDAELFIRFKNGSTYQMLGSDRFNSHVGSNTRGIIASEWALCNPKAWDYFRPIIRVNKGWAMFITTFRGMNHAFQMAKRMKHNPDWFVDIRTVEDTTKLDGSRVVTDADIEAERAEGMSEALIQQEYFCNPKAAVDGSIYGQQFAEFSEIPRAA